MDFVLLISYADVVDFYETLSPEEQALLLPKMKEYCQQQWGQSLEQCCADFLSEPRHGQELQM